MKEFTDLAFIFVTSFLYYTDYDKIDEQTRSLYRQGISAFGGISPTYRIALDKDSPVIVRDFSAPCLLWCRRAFPSFSRIKTMICVCPSIATKPLPQAGRGMNFAARSAKTSLMFTNQEKRRRIWIKKKPKTPSLPFLIIQWAEQVLHLLKLGIVLIAYLLQFHKIKASFFPFIPGFATAQIIQTVSLVYNYFLIFSAPCQFIYA